MQMYARESVGEVNTQGEVRINAKAERLEVT